MKRKNLSHKSHEKSLPQKQAPRWKNQHFLNPGKGRFFL